MPFKYAYTIDDPKAGLWEVAAEIVQETQRAVLIDASGVRAWLPRSRIIVEYRRDGTATVAMPEWLARERGFA